MSTRKSSEFHPTQLSAERIRMPICFSVLALIANLNWSSAQVLPPPNSTPVNPSPTDAAASAPGPGSAQDSNPAAPSHSPATNLTEIKSTPAASPKPLTLEERQGIDSLLQAIANQPPNPDLHQQLGQAYAKAGMLEDAEKELRTALDLAPEDGEFEYQLGQLLGRRSQLDEAEKHLREAVRLKPDLEPAHYLLGILLQKKKKAGEALEHFKKAVELKPDHWEAQFSLGMAQVGMLNLEPAADAFRAVLRLKPDYEPARRILERLELEIKEAQKKNEAR